jgi:hypothetical protein
VDWLKPPTIITACFLVVAGLGGYGLTSTRSAMERRYNAVQDDYATGDDRLELLRSVLDVVTKRLGVSEQDLEDARQIAKQLQQEKAQVRRALSGKADSREVTKSQNEETTTPSTRKPRRRSMAAAVM